MLAGQVLHLSESSTEIKNEITNSSCVSARPISTTIDTSNASELAKVKDGPIKLSEGVGVKPIDKAAKPNQEKEFAEPKATANFDNASVVENADLNGSQPQSMQADIGICNKAGQRVTRASLQKHTSSGPTSLPQPIRGRQLMKAVMSKPGISKSAKTALRPRAGSQSNLKEKSTTSAPRVTSTPRSGSLSRLATMRDLSCNSILGYFRKTNKSDEDKTMNASGNESGGEVRGAEGVEGGPGDKLSKNANSGKNVSKKGSSRQNMKIGQTQSGPVLRSKSGKKK